MATIDSSLNDSRLNASYISPLSYSMSLIIKGQKMIVSFVIGLLDISGPSAIVGRIVAVIIWVAINTILWARRISHICVKVLKFLPSLADLDVSTTIVRIMSHIGIFAPFLISHQIPKTLVLLMLCCRLEFPSLTRQPQL